MSTEYPHDLSDAQLEQGLKEAEIALLSLQKRFVQVKQGKQRKKDLQQQQNIIQQQQRSAKNSDNRQQITSQLRQLKQELAAMELNLESNLVSWSSFKEPFWLAVRFGGLGFVVGWFLKSLAG